ncbi:sulfur carrier protein ThiS adenylyltransferase ThiF [Clostridium sp. CX1]|uniref:Sulfur carrier protein ThiS adenylyltransferase ThiF n=1 Tax=Clostridium tanneri TaxID=3037988 RepID=A0ABU4JTR2_9CLOT|nr:MULTISPECIES: sulfur carrier protein ThiS adenylyltransferase ThiF [unclassified Clostridium]MCT8975655.1 sulfur carrier protein ThiS adenylyltransferase ThiF [Clostridium sp. CX1]MDW8801540.1 sulfur carrier protein ThiS adenylyltransferase ThiF [Clostridium sp. A1-XYC3]
MKITVNGKKFELECKTAFELRDQMGNEKDIVILNGFQIDEDCKVSEDDVLNIICKGTMPKKDELESMMMARHTPNVHRKLKEGKVAIAGLGGLGSNIAVMLARIGVGQLLLVDFDVVEPSNLNRQSYYISHLGMPKTTALKKQIAEINPFIKVETQNVRVTEDNVKELFSGYDIICEAFDKADAKSMLVNVALEQLTDTKIVSASGMAGYDSSNLIKTINPMNRLYMCGDLENGARIGKGLMAPRVQICAGHQANMILRLLLGINDV